MGPEVVLAWSETAHQALVARDGYANPLWAARLLAMMHLAQHDAVAAVIPVYRPHALDAREPDADAAAAAAIAAHGVLVAALPGQRAMLDAALGDSLRHAASPPGSERRARALRLGAAAAGAILALRRDDGAEAALGGRHEPRHVAGAYQVVAPFDRVIAPGWGTVRPFALGSPDRFRAPAPPALDSREYAAAFAEVKAFGGKRSDLRSRDQGASAKFWWEFSDIGWNRIARVATAERRPGLPEAARLFALLNLALADAYIAGWDSKHHHDFWRPTTAIREAARDGNPATVADPSWESAELTPPAQDYPSTHSALGRAAAEVLTAVLGDGVAFTVGSTTAVPAGSTRSFTSFRQAATENADSRVRAGLHFRFSCDAGEELGRRIAELALATQLQPRAAPAHAAVIR
jgi:hypothetical protein